MESTAMLDALRGQINLCHSHTEAVSLKYQQELKKKQEEESKRAQEEALQIEKHQQELKEKQETALREQREKEAAEAKAREEAAILAEENQPRQQGQPTGQATSQGSGTNLQMFETLKAFKSQILARLAPLDQDKSRGKFLCQKAVLTPVNSIANHSPAHLRDKLEKLQKLLRGEPVAIGTETACTGQNPLYPDFVKMTLAKKFVHQGQEVISANPRDAFPMAAVILALWSEFPDFGTLFLAHIYEACPYLVPLLPPYPREPTKEQYIALGYKYNDDDVIEEQQKFIKRMTGMTRLLAAVSVSVLPKGHEKINHPHGLGQLWRYTSNIVSYF